MTLSCLGKLAKSERFFHPPRSCRVRATSCASVRCGKIWNDLLSMLPPLSKLALQILLTLAPVCALPLVATVAEETEFPYYARVMREGVEVRSGPGRVHYGTARMAEFELIQVFRHDPGGWVAIRPPVGSFSLIQANEIEILEDGLAEVIKDGSRAWVGTRLAAVEKPLWQVQLKKGEMLEVLGKVDRKQYELDELQPDWVQIAPPAGEFRWIHEQDIEPLPASFDPEIDLEIAASESPEIEAPLNQSWDDVPLETGEQYLQQDISLDVESVAASSSSGWQPASRPIDSFVDQRSQFVADPHLRGNQDEQWGANTEVAAQLTTIRSPIFSNSSTGQPMTGQTMTAQPTTTPPMTETMGMPTNQGQPVSSAAIQQLDLRLSQELLKSPAQWDLISIAAAAQKLSDASSDMVTKSAVDRVLSKIRRCRELQAGYRATATGNGGDATNIAMQPPELATRETVGSGIQPNQSFDQLYSYYDAHGRLNELVREGGLGPSTYVLQDAQGKITHHVEAPPGLNLRRYLNQEVGIVGSRGFHQQLNLEHVTAERVIVLDRVRR